MFLFLPLSAARPPGFIEKPPGISTPSGECSAPSDAFCTPSGEFSTPSDVFCALSGGLIPTKGLFNLYIVVFWPLTNLDREGAGQKSHFLSGV